MYIYIYIYIVHTYIYILYIHIERERERGFEKFLTTAFINPSSITYFSRKLPNYIKICFTFKICILPQPMFLLDKS